MPGQTTTLTEELKAALPQFTLDNLSKFSRGKTGRLWDQAFNSIVRHLAQFPLRDGKPEHAKLTLELDLSTIMAKSKPIPMEDASGEVRETFGPPVIKGLRGSIKIKPGINALQTDDVVLATELRNGSITGIYFNPDDNNSPLTFDQTNFDFDEDEDNL